MPWLARSRILTLGLLSVVYPSPSSSVVVSLVLARSTTVLGSFRIPTAFAPRVPPCHHSSRLADLDIGYVLIQTITSGEMLPESWDEKRDDVRLQQNLQRDLASIILSLASIRQPRIGSFRLDGKGYRHLDNRPLNV